MPLTDLRIAFLNGRESAFTAVAERLSEIAKGHPILTVAASFESLAKDVAAMAVKSRDKAFLLETEDE